MEHSIFCAGRADADHGEADEGSDGRGITFEVASTCCKRLVMNPIFSDELLCLQTIRHLAAALGKLCHDLLVQPEVHFRRAVEGASITELLRQLLSSAKAAVQFHQL